MSSEKQVNRDQIPRPPKEDINRRKQEEFTRGNAEKERTKSKRVNYIVKDLPIY